MSDKTRPTPSLHDDVPTSKANDVIKETRAAIERMVRVGVDNHEALIRSAVGSHGMMEGGGMPARMPRTPMATSASPAPAPSVPAGNGSLIYGDGNIVTEGDIVQDSNQMLAEVKMVAGNGIVLDQPGIGVKVIQPSDLLTYKRMGNKRA